MCESVIPNLKFWLLKVRALHEIVSSGTGRPETLRKACLWINRVLGSRESYSCFPSALQICTHNLLCGCKQVSVASTGFGGQQFWELLRGSAMEAEVRLHYSEARSVLPKRGGTPLQVRLALQSNLSLVGTCATIEEILLQGILLSLSVLAAA